MKKLETALNELGLTQSFFDELKAELETEKLVAENGLLSATKDDVEDEYNHLEASTDDEVDELTDCILHDVDYDEVLERIKNKRIKWAIC